MFAYCGNSSPNFSDFCGTKMTCFVVVNDGSGNSRSKDQGDSNTHPSDDEQTEFTIVLDTKWKLVLFEATVGTITVGGYITSILTIIASVNAAPMTFGASIAMASIAFDMLVGSGVGSVSSLSLMTDAYIKYRQQGITYIEYYSPDSADHFWEWLINLGWRVRKGS